MSDPSNAEMNSIDVLLLIHYVPKNERRARPVGLDLKPVSSVDDEPIKVVMRTPIMVRTGEYIRVMGLWHNKLDWPDDAYTQFMVTGVEWIHMDGETRVGNKVLHPVLHLEEYDEVLKEGG